MIIPKYKKITKKEYTRLKDNPICDVIAIPIFEKGSGIIEHINGEAKIIGYEYYLEVGVEHVLFMGSEQVKKFYNWYKQHKS